MHCQRTRCSSAVKLKRRYVLRIRCVTCGVLTFTVKVVNASNDQEYKDATDKLEVVISMAGCTCLTRSIALRCNLVDAIVHFLTIAKVGVALEQLVILQCLKVTLKMNMCLFPHK